MMKNTIRALVCVLALCLLFAGCAKKNDDVLRVAVDDTTPPMEFKDEKGETVGFDVDVATEVAKRLGREVQIISTSWDGIFQGLNTDRYDCIISSVSLTPEREEQFAMTRPYVSNSQILVVKAGDDSIQSIDDIAGKTVSCQVGTTSAEAAAKLLETIDFEHTEYDQVNQLFADMKAGRIDAILTDEVVGMYYIEKNPEDFQAASLKLSNEPIGVCLKKENTALRDEIQKVLDDMVEDGTMAELSVKWFGEDMTSNIDESYQPLA